MVHVVCLCLCSGFPSKRDSGMIWVRYLKKRHGARELIGDFNAIKRLSEKKKRGEAHLFLAAALRISSAKVKWSHWLGIFNQNKVFLKSWNDSIEPLQITTGVPYTPKQIWLTCPGHCQTPIFLRCKLDLPLAKRPFRFEVMCVDIAQDEKLLIKQFPSSRSTCSKASLKSPSLTCPKSITS